MSSAPPSSERSTEALSNDSTSVQPEEERDQGEKNQSNEPSSPSQSVSSQSAWQVFASTFVTIFLAELGDKTQVTTLLMSAESHKPWIVFAGAGSALVATSLLGVLLGRWLATRLSPKTLETSAGITLLVIATWLGWDIISGLK